MRLIVSLSVIFIFMSLLVVHSTSFSTTKVKNEATLSVTTESNALIAISYTNGKKFEIRNNTNRTIVVENVELMSETKNDIINVNVPFSLTPGSSRELNITADPKELTGKVIEVKTHWNGGSAIVKSTIPNLQENK
ncbi:hypothetical protein [Sporosarcina jiandibaonis]|uniref:hypothetical protein n=1 Tax=Sporosarcina jiandibaonis TaxID=2715535 RepID=UPI001557C5BC|nr:hypothetical protein [Sporosarcina jiandibaonis]